jgi:hypothetical protein
MTRKLLPFEHDLIDLLGVSKEEYLEFIALQAETNDVKNGTVLDIQNGPLAVPIVLAVVGIVFNVVSTLLAPRPQTPEIPTFRQEDTGGQAQTRDERFSPRFGFNSVQELSKYGDPVNLVYANRGTGTGANPNGGVRVTTSLLWSAVRSYGSSQFIQMLLLLSGGAITAIDPEKSAFGQTPIRDLITENLWMYFRASSTGLLTQADEINDKEAQDPTNYGTGADNPYRLQPNVTANTRVDGFSQAYSPTTSNSCGIYGVVPLNINVYIRNAAGDAQAANLRISASMTPWVSSTEVVIPVNTVLTVGFEQTTGSVVASADAEKESAEARRSLISTFDAASIFNPTIHWLHDAL